MFSLSGGFFFFLALRLFFLRAASLARCAAKVMNESMRYESHLTCAFLIAQTCATLANPIAIVVLIDSALFNRRLMK
jgi:hypothetical protein